MSPPSSSFKKKLRRKKPALVRAKRIVSTCEHSHYKTALSQSRINIMSYKKRIQKLLENNKSLAQALEAAEIARQQQEHVILSLQKQLTLMNPSVVKRGIKKMGMLTQQVVTIMADTLEHLAGVDDDEEEEEEDVTEAQLQTAPAANESNNFYSVPGGTPLTHSTAAPQRRSLHNDLREKFGICDLTVINEDTLRLQEMTLPPILFTEDEHNINTSRNSKRNSSRHKSSRKGTISSSERGSSVESSDPSGRNKEQEFAEFPEGNSLHGSSVGVSGQHSVLQTPMAKVNRCDELPSSDIISPQTPKTPVLCPLVFSRTKQVLKSNIPRLVDVNRKKSACDEILCSNLSSDPVQRRETFVVSNGISHNAASVLQRLPNEHMTVSEATSSNQSCVIDFPSHSTGSAKKSQHAAQTLLSLKESMHRIPYLSGNIPQNMCVVPSFENMTVNLNEDMELTSALGNFLAPPETHTEKVKKLGSETDQQPCDKDEMSDVTEIYDSRQYSNALSLATKLRSQSQKEPEIPVVDVMNHDTDEASDVTEIYNVKAYCSASCPKDQTDKAPEGPGRSPAAHSGMKTKETDGSIVSRCGTKTKETDGSIVSKSCSPLQDHNVKASSGNSVSGDVELEPHETVTQVLKKSEFKQPSERDITRVSKSKGNDTPLPKSPQTVSSSIDSDTCLQSLNRRGTFVVQRQFEEQYVDSQPSTSGFSTLGKRKSRITPSDSQQEHKLGSKPKSSHESASKNSPCRSPEKANATRSPEKAGKASKPSKKSSSISESWTLGRKKLHLSQFSKTKSNNDKRGTKKEPNFKFFSKKSNAILIKDTVEKKTDEPDQNHTDKTMDVYDIVSPVSGDDQAMGKSLRNTDCEENFVVLKGSQKCTDFSNKRKTSLSTKQVKRKSVNKEGERSKKAKLDSHSQNRNEGSMIDPPGGVSQEKEQSHHKPNLRSHDRRKSVSFRMPSNDDILLFNHNESICLSSKTDHKTAQVEEGKKEQDTREKYISESPAMEEETQVSEVMQFRKSFVVLEDIFSQASKECDSDKQEDNIQHSSSMRTGGGGGSSQASNSSKSSVTDTLTTKSPKPGSVAGSKESLPKDKSAPDKGQKMVALHGDDNPEMEGTFESTENKALSVRYEEAKRKSIGKGDSKNKGDIADGAVAASKKQAVCESSEPSSDKEKGKRPSKTVASHSGLVDVHKSNISPSKSKKAKVLPESRKSNRKDGRSVNSAETDSHPTVLTSISAENVNSVEVKDHVETSVPESEKKPSSNEPREGKGSSKDPSTESSDDARSKRTSKKTSKGQNTGGGDVPSESKKENVPDRTRSNSLARISLETLNTEREPSGRTRRKTGVICYKEPSIGFKLRRGDTFFSKN